MIGPLEVVLRSSAILAAALIAARLLHRRPAALRHAIVAGALFLATAVGPIGAVLPAWTIVVPAPAPGSWGSAPVSLATPPRADLGGVVEPTGIPFGEGSASAWLPRVLVALWLAGAGVVLLRRVAAERGLRRLARASQPLTNETWTRLARAAAAAAGLRRPVVLLETDARDVLATWGVARPRLLVPSHARTWPPDRIQAVLCHEMAHVARCDWLVQAAADVGLAALWYNPLAWIAVRRLRLESERACDDAVLRRGLPPRAYAAHLVAIARACRLLVPTRTAAPSMAHFPDLHARITAMLNSSSPAQALSPRAVALVVLALLALALPLSALRLAADEPRTLTGVVYDPTGAVVPGAMLALEGEPQVRLQAVSDTAGHFAFTPVAPGRYVLSVTLPGFRLLKQALELGSDGDWHRAITLQLGDVQETITIRSARLPATQPAATPARVRVGGKISPPRKLRDVRPVYPESMRAAGIEGKVALEAIIGRDGSVQSARVVSGLVHPDLGQAAIDAVRQWKFEPTMLNGAPVEVVMNVALTFELEG